MTTKKETELAVVDPQVLAELRELYPVEEGNFNRIFLPRLGYYSQDVMEGEGKKKVCVMEAGTFTIERQTEELDENGKKKWSTEEIGSELDGVILYHRYQLSYYDSAEEEYTSSPVYDSSEEIIPLFKNKKQVAKGTPKELKDMYLYTDPKDGKQKSNLKDNRILYVLYKDELFQLNLHGTSMFSFMKYARTVNPPTVLTHFASEPQENGATKWNMMTFKPTRTLEMAEVIDVLAKVKDIKLAIVAEKGPVTEYSKENKEAELRFEQVGKSDDIDPKDIPF